MQFEKLYHQIYGRKLTVNVFEENLNNIRARPFTNKSQNFKHQNSLLRSNDKTSHNNFNNATGIVNFNSVKNRQNIVHVNFRGKYGGTNETCHPRSDQDTTVQAGSPAMRAPVADERARR